VTTCDGKMTLWSGENCTTNIKQPQKGNKHSEMRVKVDVEKIESGGFRMRLDGVLLADVVDGELHELLTERKKKQKKPKPVLVVQKKRRETQILSPEGMVKEGWKSATVTATEWLWSKNVCLKGDTKCMGQFKGKWCVKESGSWNEKFGECEFRRALDV